MSKKKTRRGIASTQRHRMEMSNNYKEQKLQEYWSNTSLKRISRWDTGLRIFRKETNKEREERLLARKGEIKNMTALETSLTARVGDEINLNSPVTVTKDEDHARWDEIVNQPTTEPIEEADFTPAPPPSVINAWDNENEMDKYGYHPNLVKNIRARLANSTTGWFTDLEKTFLLTQIEFSRILFPKTSHVAVIRHVLTRWKLYNTKTKRSRIESKIDKNVRYWKRDGSYEPQITESLRYYRQVTRKRSPEDRKILKGDYILLRSYRFSIHEAAQIVNAIHGTDYAAKTVRSWSDDGTPPSSIGTSSDQFGEEYNPAKAAEVRETPSRDEEPVEKPRPVVEVQNQTPGANMLIVKLIATIDKQDTAMSNLAKAIIKLTSQLNDQDRRIEELESLATEPRDKDTSLNLGDLNEQDAQVIKRFMEGAA